MFLLPSTITRNVIFISHATPEDNDFTIWLASRLQAEGFEVWIDKQALVGGEKFWQEIDQVIRHKAVKFLLVYSENICYQKQRGILKNGVAKEISMAEGIATTNGLKDFMILLNVDGSEYNLFIGADTLNQVPFYENWAGGYSQLRKKFKKEGLEPTGSPVGDFSKWYEDEYVIHHGIENLHEIYYDCWWPIPELPESFFVYIFPNNVVASQVHQRSKYPTGKASNILASFYDTSEFEVEIDGQLERIPFTAKHEIKVSDVIARTVRLGFPGTRDVENYFRSLLQRTFHLIMKERHLHWYEMANMKQAYFFSAKSHPKIKFEYPHRATKAGKSKVIFGKHLSSFWHYALSAKPIITPQLAFGLKSHIVFTTDGVKLWDDKAKMHTARRRKGRLMFNEEWRDLLFAFLHALCQGGTTVNIMLNPTFELALKPWTNTYHSDFGYIEPKGQDRHDILAAEYEYQDREDIDPDEVANV
ncbi:toll/interleukin-1 receptor domain-containing protein [Geobacter sulfurreducens]|uniref:TIR domain-containing protein n=1 Tax=Geobacter sulfurreducens (strain ATCC 51573 / DSM 12127 / PCA) TaxID=243231 RepID=Q74FQ3_GEOSL|nr:toll/interleukin-1 receptor domain-containing protein [Geobacter sulfurreducens]AAR33884.1 hypothetical protein GSU0553 [Geobacter sulfurreducens PCA]UAC04628.1 toll/interleukin-1 receptor domain-containing protein [Geobacter sulfurreducens]HBB69078.1 TIR domain-containing protein [Geobacter sulfurreducens]HCD96101.1 TIR domain-containing protein [Geobacter sulfurreducens]